jgi:hypothetical protein
MAGKKRLKGRQVETQRKERKDSKSSKNMTQRKAR